MNLSKVKPVGVSILEKNGIDVDVLIDQLVKNASVEFTAYYYFTNLRLHCVGLEGEGRCQKGPGAKR